MVKSIAGAIESGASYAARMDEEEEHLIALQQQEEQAATVMQKRLRGENMRRKMPEVRREALYLIAQHKAATRLQAVARGWLLRPLQKCTSPRCARAGCPPRRSPCGARSGACGASTSRRAAAPPSSRRA